MIELTWFIKKKITILSKNSKTVQYIFQFNKLKFISYVLNYEHKLYNI